MPTTNTTSAKPTENKEKHNRLDLKKVKKERCGSRAVKATPAMLYTKIKKRPQKPEQLTQPPIPIAASTPKSTQQESNSVPPPKKKRKVTPSGLNFDESDDDDDDDEEEEEEQGDVDAFRVDPDKKGDILSELSQLSRPPKPPSNNILSEVSPKPVSANKVPTEELLKGVAAQLAIQTTPRSSQISGSSQNGINLRVKKEQGVTEADDSFDYDPPMNPPRSAPVGSPSELTTPPSPVRSAGSIAAAAQSPNISVASQFSINNNGSPFDEATEGDNFGAQRATGQKSSDLRDIFNGNLSGLRSLPRRSSTPQPEANEEDDEASELRELFKSQVLKCKIMSQRDLARCGMIPLDEVEDDENEDEEEAEEEVGNDIADDEELDNNDEEEEEEERDGMEGEDDDSERIAVLCGRAKAAQRVLEGSALNRDKRRSEQTLMEAADKEIKKLRRSPVVTAKMSLAICTLDYGDEEEIQDSVVDVMERDIREKMMDMKAQTFIGWVCGEREKVIIEDGRHRLIAIKRYITNFNKTCEPADRIHDKQFKVRVTMLRDNKMGALIRKMASVPNAKPTVFENVLHYRFVLEGLKLVNNEAMTMQIRQKVLKKITGAGTGSKIPIYYVQSACFSDREIKFIRDNTRSTLVDAYPVLTLYIKAKEINPNRAFSLLMELDGIDDNQKELRTLTCNSLERMLHNCGEMLMFRGYQESDANRVNATILKCPNSFSTLRYHLAHQIYFNKFVSPRRIVNASRKLAKVSTEIDMFLLKLETCLPPVTFVVPQITAMQLHAATQHTLFIFDDKEFNDELVPRLLALITSVTHGINILVVNGDYDTIKTTIQTAMMERRAAGIQRMRGERPPSSQSMNQSRGERPPSSQSMNQSRGERPPSSQSMSQTMNQSMTHSPVAAQPSSPREVGIVSVTVGCAAYNDVTSTGLSLSKDNVGAFLLRAKDREILSESALLGHLKKMGINSTIDRTALRLLSISTDKETPRPSAIFVHGSTPAPIAVAAYCSSHRIGTLASLSDHLKRELSEKQHAMTATWADWPKYAKFYSNIGIMKENPGVIKTRKKRSKLSAAIASGLLDADDEND